MVLLFSWGFASASPPLPPILQILEQEPQTLDAIEQRIDLNWHDQALLALKNYPADDPRVQFLKARALMGKKRYEAALKFLEQITDEKWREEARWKKAQVLSRLKQYDAALLLYAELIAGEDRQREREQLRWAAFKTALEAREYAAGLEFLKHLKGAKADWWRGWALFRLNKPGAARHYWEKIPGHRSGDFYPRALFWRAQLLAESGQKEEALDLARRLVRRYPDHYYGFLARRSFLEGTAEEPGSSAEDYPKPFFEMVSSEAEKRGLDVYLVLALMKQESHFDPMRVSPAGAMGLMQMIPQTVLRLAEASGKKGFQWPELFDPAFNITLGCFYLQFLSKLFRGEAAYILAAYNAGEEAVSRWLSLRQDEPVHFFVEEIPYGQTQHYTQKVLANYWVYRRLY